MKKEMKKELVQERKSITFLNAREAREIIQKIEEHFGASAYSLLESYSFVKTNKDKLHMISRGVDGLEMDRVNSVGLYIADLQGDSVRLSMEGAALIGSSATKNVVELDADELKKWLRGEDLQKKGEWDGFVLLKYKTDFVGSGKYSNGTIYNFVPKTRRVKELIV